MLLQVKRVRWVKRTRIVGLSKYQQEQLKEEEFHSPDPSVLLKVLGRIDVKRWAEIKAMAVEHEAEELPEIPVHPDAPEV